MPVYRDEGVVLRTHKLGEADRIITLLTRHHGRVRAVAKGVRRTSSRIGGRLEPFMLADVQLHEGRSMWSPRSRRWRRTPPGSPATTAATRPAPPCSRRRSG